MPLAMRFPVLVSFLLGARFLAACGAPATSGASAAKPAPPRIEYVGAWGTKGSGPGQFEDPRAIASDDFNNVYIADAGATASRIDKFSADGHPLLSVMPVQRLVTPCGLTVDSGGAVYVLECRSGALFIFFPDGTLLRQIHGGLAGIRPSGPASVAVDDHGRICVGEARAAHILRFSTAGRILDELPANKSAADSLGAIDQVAAAASGIYIMDASRRRVTHVSDEGVAEEKLEWSADALPAGAQNLAFLAATQKYVIALTGLASAPVLRVWSLAAELKYTGPLPLDPALGTVNYAGLAATPSGELLLLDTAGTRVLHFRLNL
jgi:hypothetical protein